MQKHILITGIIFLILASAVYSQADPFPPVIIAGSANNTFLDLRVTNQTVNFTVTDNIDILNVSWYVFNDSGIQAEQHLNISGNGNTSFTFNHTVDISNFGGGVYSINRIVYDSSNQSAVLFSKFTLIDFNLFNTIVSPINNSVISFTADMDANINFVHEVGAISTCHIHFNDTQVNVGHMEEAGTHTEQVNVRSYNTSNFTVMWFESCLIDGFQEVNSSFHLLTVQYLPSQTEQFSLNMCPNTTTTSVFFYLVLLFIAFMLMVMDVALFKAGVFGFLGSFLLLALSLPIYYCIGAFAMLMTIAGVAGIMYFLGRGLRSGGFMGG